MTINAKRALLTFTALGIAVYWLLVFTGVFPVDEIVPGYKNWFLSFPLADTWIALAALLTLKNELKRPNNALIYQAATGSGLLFLGLYALLYGINTRLLFNLTTDEVIEILIKLYCLSVGSYFLKDAIKNINKLSHREESHGQS